MSPRGSESTALTNRATQAPTNTDTLLQITDVSRSFGETKALRSASLTVRYGEIHSLAGENGSGKSTMMKILGGVVRPQSGTITWQGAPVRFANPRAAQNAGITMVFQETLVVPELSVRDNIFIGTDRMFRHGRNRREEAVDAAAALDHLGLGALHLDTPLWQLSLAERQLVTIARAIVRPWKLLILDESSSALDLGQRDRLFDYLRFARADGRSVLFTSHRMDEVEDLADSVSVLRLGTSVARLDIGQTSTREILQLMAGRDVVERVEEVAEAEAPRTAAELAPSEPVLELHDVTLRRTSKALSLTLGRGEILGVGGLEGQGQVELADCIASISRPVSGRVRVLDSEGEWKSPRSFADANRKGIAFVPRDRRHEGLFTPLSILDNFAFGVYPKANRFGVLRRKAIRAQFHDYAKRLRLVYGADKDTIGTLSGGNQQKVLLARWLATNPRILVLNDPMRGVDANTKSELYTLLRSLAADGLSIILVSTEILELLTLCERIAVFHEGNLQALLPAEGTTETDVMAAMFGHASEEKIDG